MIPDAPPDRFATAARAYLVYAIVYWVGGLYLVWHGVGVAGTPTGARRLEALVFWGLVGLVPLVLIPWLLARRRGWFERWVLSRRDFARIVALLLALRAWKVLEVAVRGGGSVPAPWGGEIGFRAGAIVFFVVTAAALVLVARAAWSREAA
ncbi:MAG TPA: hypothetical protein VNN07_15400 [Candidatus Tectomicrobia bacterium]|nr:hypothetical protein [Candidatus Tectomicrobia bacterium]